MAGSYPDVPGARMEYDRDGTLGFSVNHLGTVFTALTSTQMQQLNDEDTVGGITVAGDPGRAVVLIFPELRDIVGAFRAVANTVVDVSSNTTNGFDGTWTQVQTTAQGVNATGVVQPFYRTSIHAFSSAGVKAIRVRQTGTGTITLNAFHVYGHLAAASDRLELWHPTIDQPLRLPAAFTDYGDKQRAAGPYDLTFRVKNLSSTLTAGSITVSVEALTDASPTTHVSELSLKYDGGAFGPTATLSSLAPNTISPALFTVRFNPGASSALGLGRQRLLAIASSWT